MELLAAHPTLESTLQTVFGGHRRVCSHLCSGKVSSTWRENAIFFFSEPAAAACLALLTFRELVCAAPPGRKKTEGVMSHSIFTLVHLSFSPATISIYLTPSQLQSHLPAEMMQATDFISFVITVAGPLAVIFYLPVLIPRNVVPQVSDALNETLALLPDEHLPRADEHRATQAILAHEFARLRTTSHGATGLLSQVWIAIRGTTCRLYALLSSIRAFQREMELAIDGHQLATLDNAQRAVGPAQAVPGNDVAAPVANTAEPAPPAPPPA